MAEVFRWFNNEIHAGFSHHSQMSVWIFFACNQTQSSVIQARVNSQVWLSFPVNYNLIVMATTSLSYMGCLNIKIVCLVYITNKYLILGSLKAIMAQFMVSGNI